MQNDYFNELSSEKREELIKLLKKEYQNLKNKYWDNEQEILSPYSQFLEQSKNENLINEFQAEQLKGCNNWHSILFQAIIIEVNDELGNVIYIDKKEINNSLNVTKSFNSKKEINFNSVWFRPKFKTYSLKNTFIKNLTKDVEKSRLIYTSNIPVNKRLKVKFINKCIEDLSDSIFNFNKQIEVAKNYHIYCLKTITDLLKNELNNIMFSEFESIGLSNIIKVKKIFPASTNFLEQKNKQLGFRLRKDYLIGFLKKELEGNKLIEPTEISHFNNVFLNKPIIKKVNWIGGKSMLHYFFKNLKKNKIISETQIWKRVSHCFLLSNTEIESTSLSRQKAPAKKDVIDTIISKL